MNRLVNDGGPGRAVEMRTLDGILEGRTASAKMDVEGAELYVLLGAQRSLEEGRLKLIQIEWDVSNSSLGDIADLLGHHGYTLHRAGPGGLVPAADLTVGGDLFAVPPTMP